MLSSTAKFSIFALIATPLFATPPDFSYPNAAHPYTEAQEPMDDGEQMGEEALHIESYLEAIDLELKRMNADGLKRIIEVIEESIIPQIPHKDSNWKRKMIKVGKSDLAEIEKVRSALFKKADRFDNEQLQFLRDIWNHIILNEYRMYKERSVNNPKKLPTNTEILEQIIEILKNIDNQ